MWSNSDAPTRGLTADMLPQCHDAISATAAKVMDRMLQLSRASSDRERERERGRSKGKETSLLVSRISQYPVAINLAFCLAQWLIKRLAIWQNANYKQERRAVAKRFTIHDPNPYTPPPSLGLLGMRERLCLLRIVYIFR